jgi:class 3 adenylate cyclase/DNA-binding SARP family transcriptional activator
MASVRILGSVEASVGERPLPVGGSRQLKLFALLVLHANRAVSSDAIIDAVWGSERGRSDNRLQMAVARLRKALQPLDDGGGSRLRTVSGGYLLSIAPGELDAEVFANLVVEGRRALDADDPAQARELLRAALGLWRGPPLAEVAFEDFAQPEVRRLEELRLTALEIRIDAELGLGHHGKVIGELESLLAQHPSREQIAGQLMLALYRTGRQADALQTYQRVRAHLLEELGLEPGPALKILQTQILEQAPSLRPITVRSEDRKASKQPCTPGDSVARHSMANTAGSENRPLVVRASERRRKRRKVVTALFCDVTGSTRLGEELDPELLHEVMNSYWRGLRAVIERHGGTVDRFIGDAVMAVFGIPQVHEDDALRAVHAAVEIRERVPEIAAKVGVSLVFRTAVNTGLVLVADGENLAIGDAVNVAARLEQAAAPGEILLGEETYRLVRDAVRVEPLGPLSVRGRSAAVGAFRLTTLDPVAPAMRRSFGTPLVGRERELRVLHAAWQRTVDESSCHLFTLVGAAGVGKSRLVAELFASVDNAATVLSGRCRHYGEGIAFWPLVEALTPVGDPGQDVREHVGSGGAATTEELFLEVRRLLDSLAQNRPLILHIDDLQWAESMLLDALNYVVDVSRGAPILVICTARSELLEQCPGWSGGKLNATTMLLEALPPTDCGLLLDQLGNGLPDALRTQVIRASEGNPLFLEEMAAFARERAAVAVPPTILALLVARLEQLPDTERELLEHAAIEGGVFHHRALTHLLRDSPVTAVGSGLTALVRKDVIRPHPSTLAGDEAFRFRHLLIRDAAYDSIPKVTRADLHERFATWLENDARELPDLDEIAGWHLERAISYQHEVRRDQDTTLARRAAHRLHAAGQRATRRGDPQSATNLLKRAYALVDDDQPFRARIGVELAEALIEGDDLARVDELLSDAESLPETAALATLTRLEWLWIARPREASATLRSVLPNLFEQLSDQHDERGLARAHLLALGPHWSECKASATAEQALTAARHAEKAGDMGIRARALQWQCAALIYGPAGPDTIRRELHAIESDQSSGPSLQAAVALAQAFVAQLDDNLTDARALTDRARTEFSAIGNHALVAGCDQFLGAWELRAGNASEARELLLAADAALEKAGDRGHRSTTLAELAQAHEAMGDHALARSALDLSEKLGDADDVVNRVTIDLVRAELALADGDPHGAERRARTAVDHAAKTDFVGLHAAACLELARVLAALGREDEAATSAGRAMELYRMKSDRVGAQQVQALNLRLTLDRVSD